MSKVEARELAGWLNNIYFHPLGAASRGCVDVDWPFFILQPRSSLAGELIDLVADQGSIHLEEAGFPRFRRTHDVVLRLEIASVELTNTYLLAEKVFTTLGCS